MRIAIPWSQGLLSPHFGHCEEFALLDVDPQQKAILTSTRRDARGHR
jgi:predicted Fe-Mo cluster-binding NifX family protein